MRLPRPYIPLAVRVQVAERQLQARDAKLAASVLYGVVYETARRKLTVLLGCLFGQEPHHLDHDPALVNRRWNNRTKDYEPRANDPAHLVYRTKVDHDIKTRVRGIGAQRSDLSQRRYNKKVARNREKRKVDKFWAGVLADDEAIKRWIDENRRQALTPGGRKAKRPKRKWPSRKIDSRRKQ